MAESYFGACRYTDFDLEREWFDEYLNQQKFRLKELVGIHIVEALLKEKNIVPVITEQTVKQDGRGTLSRSPFLYEYQIRVDFVEKEKWNGSKV